MHAVTRVAGIAVLLTLTGAAKPMAHADDWPQWLGPRRDGVWRETGLVARFPADGPKVLWRAEVGGGFTGPAVAGGRVYVMDRQGDPLAKGQEAPAKDGLKGKERVLCFGQCRQMVLRARGQRLECEQHRQVRLCRSDAGRRDGEAVSLCARISEAVGRPAVRDLRGRDRGDRDEGRGAAHQHRGA